MFRDPTVVQHPFMGVCYSFNYHPPGSGGAPAESTLAGEIYGLHLTLNLDSNLYLRDEFSPRLGAKVLIHEPDHFPIISSQGISLAPNRMYSFRQVGRSGK